MIDVTPGIAIQRVLQCWAELRHGWRETLDRLFGSPALYGQVNGEKAELQAART